jgi:hypothetical protein
LSTSGPSFETVISGMKIRNVTAWANVLEKECQIECIHSTNVEASKAHPESLSVRKHVEAQEAHRRILSNCILKEQGAEEWTGSTWFTRRTSVRILWINFRFHKGEEYLGELKTLRFLSMTVSHEIN